MTSDSLEFDDERPAWQVALVGAGPGHPGLLTLRAAEVLGEADVVLYDGLSNRDLLVHASQAEHISVGKHGQSRIWKQPEIIQEILQHARAGRKVVRLKGGDPAVFARTSEEVDAIRAADLAFEIVPGITAALAAGSFAGIPATHRGLASAVALVTGHEEPGKPASDLDWEALARFPGTLVIYMGVTTAERWTRQLIEGGKPGDTPAAIIRRCSLPDQQVVHCRLDEVSQRLTPASKMRPPVITIVGDVTNLADDMSWFDRRPLFGKTILVTRPETTPDDLTHLLEQQGALVLSAPAIAIRPVEDASEIDAVIERLAASSHSFASADSFGSVDPAKGESAPLSSEETSQSRTPDTIVFCSRNGVNHFLGRVFAQGHDVRLLAGIRIAVVGSKTAEAVRDWNLQVDLIPDDFRGDALAQRLIKERTRSCLVVRASRGSDTWIETIRESGIEVRQVVAYQNQDVSCWDPQVIEALQKGKVDWVTVTSSATVQNVARLAGDLIGHARLASLSPVTSRRAEKLGLHVHAEAEVATMAGLVKAIIAQEREHSS